jgi:hypothetical protein
MNRLLRATVLALAIVSSAASAASACPMCKEANAQDENRPRAYMYSILFMMSMPAVLVTVFGVGLYRLHRKQQSLADEPTTDVPLRYPLATDRPE